jgi:hypothetical protein
MRRPRAGRGVIAADFPFRGNSAANGRVGKQDDIPLQVRRFRGMGCRWPARMMDRQPQPGAAGDPRSSRTPDLFGSMTRDTPGMANLKTDGPIGCGITTVMGRAAVPAGQSGRNGHTWPGGEGGEGGGAPKTTALPSRCVLSMPFDLMRHDLLMTLKPV